MKEGEYLLLLGASTRAAAFSALRAGLRPWCADLFADMDLQGHCPVQRVQPGRYPDGFLALVRRAPAAPWLYTGALENRPALVERIAAERPLWGNNADVLATVRSPLVLQQMFRGAGTPYPAVRM